MSDDLLPFLEIAFEKGKTLSKNIYPSIVLESL